MFFFTIGGRMFHYNTMEEFNTKLKTIFAEVQAECSEAENRWFDLKSRENQIGKYLRSMTVPSIKYGGCNE